ncbi:MAG: PilZ domain-containing protein, partial [Pseudomonadota bacterium]
LKLISYHAMDIGKQARIKIELKKRMKLSVQEMTVEIEARWIRPYSGDLHCIGCCFVDIDETQLALINEIQMAFGFEPDFSPARWASDNPK